MAILCTSLGHTAPDLFDAGRILGRGVFRPQLFSFNDELAVLASALYVRSSVYGADSIQTGRMCADNHLPDTPGLAHSCDERCKVGAGHRSGGHE